MRQGFLVVGFVDFACVRALAQGALLAWDFPSFLSELVQSQKFCWKSSVYIKVTRVWEFVSL